jgi:hypothetical protein
MSLATAQAATKEQEQLVLEEKERCVALERQNRALSDEIKAFESRME